jgi:hypothetical protein
MTIRRPAPTFGLACHERWAAAPGRQRIDETARQAAD